MGGSISKAVGVVGKGLGAIATGGTSLIPGSPTKKIGNMIGSALTLQPGGIDGGLHSDDMKAPTVGGKQDPLSILTMSGGAPLLTNIALGADVGNSIMGYFGGGPDYQTWLNNLSPSDQEAIKGVASQLIGIQQNTDLRNQTVQKLANDFPNIMAASIPKYSAMADDATKNMMDQALNQISAKQAAGGTLSSGATAAAAARAGGELGMQKINFGTNLALQDFNQQYNAATALQTFQQKMLGQGASQGFNAVQNALSRNAGVNQQQANLNYEAGAANNQSNQAMWGALGSLGGTAIGAALGGPAGASAGGQMGNSIASPRLNMQYNNLSNSGTNFPNKLSL